MSVLKTGVAFVLGAMWGSFITRGLQHDHLRHRHWPCPRQALEKKRGTTPEGEENASPPIIADNININPM